jgi:hypothetical protein
MIYILKIAPKTKSIIINAIPLNTSLKDSGRLSYSIFINFPIHFEQTFGGERLVIVGCLEYIALSQEGQ